MIGEDWRGTALHEEDSHVALISFHLRRAVSNFSAI